jgi:hypothetical protein
MIAVLLAELGATVTLLCGIQGRRFIFSNSIFFLSQFYCGRYLHGRGFSPSRARVCSIMILSRTLFDETIYYD